MKKQYTKCALNLEMTLQECANELGCSLQAVQLIENKALRKLSRALYAKFGDSVKIEDLLPMEYSK